MQEMARMRAEMRLKKAALNTNFSESWYFQNASVLIGFHGKSGYPVPDNDADIHPLVQYNLQSHIESHHNTQTYYKIAFALAN